MYFLLFIIGFEINFKKLKKQSGFIFKATFFIIFLEALFGTLLVHFVFHYTWLISFLVALSFATVGEAMLVPILDEFRIINKKLGQSIIGIGTLDDIIEVLLLIFIAVLIGSKKYLHFNITETIISLAALLILTISLVKLKKKGRSFNFLSIETLFLFILFGLFLFLGIGRLAHAMPIGAFLAGIALKTFIPDERIERVKTALKTMCYGFFAPIFFVWVGISLDISYLIAAPLLILLVVGVSKSAKILGSYIIGKKELGTKQSILLGIGLSVRFSTSIIIIKILFENNLVGQDLYSVIVASSIAFKFIVPVLFSNLLVRWKVAKLPSKRMIR
jgi:Kef-type K+ transport system membrane component KefB